MYNLYLQKLGYKDSSELASFLNKSYNSHKSKNSKSCETLYYGLFTDGTNPKINFRGDGENTSLQRIREENTRAYAKNGLIIELNREEKAKSLRTKALPVYSHVTEFIKAQISNDKNFYYYKKLNAERSRRIDAAQFVVERGSGDAFSTILDTKERAGTMTGGTTLGYNSRGIPIYSILNLAGKNQLIVNDSYLEQNQSPATHAFTLGHEVGHFLEIAPKELVECLSGADALGIRKDNVTFSQPGLAYDQGVGTEHVRDMMDLIESNPSRAHQEYERLKTRGELPSQAEEAIADYIGGRAAIDYIKTHYSTPEEQRNAALAILFSFPPQPIEDNNLKIMDGVGAKPTNQTRMLRGLMGHTEFRKMIGCDFEDRRKTPKDCSQTTMRESVEIKVNSWFRTQ